MFLPPSPPPSQYAPTGCAHVPSPQPSTAVLRSHNRSSWCNDCHLVALPKRWAGTSGNKIFWQPSCFTTPLHPPSEEGGPGCDEEPWELASTHRIPCVEVAPPLRGQQGQVAQRPLEFQGDNGKWALGAVSACQQLKLRHPIQSTGAKQKLILKTILGKRRGKTKRDLEKSCWHCGS